MIRVFAFLAGVMLNCSAIAQPSNTSDAADASVLHAVTVIKDVKASYSAFVNAYLIVSPHPDPSIERFVSRTRGGDADGLAFVSFMVWQGFAGFHENKAVAKMAMVRAMDDGSAGAAGFIGQTFERNPGNATEERTKSYTSALYWYGVAVGMGEPRVYDQALKLINSIAGTDDPATRTALMSHFNGGLQEGTSRKKSKLP